MAGRPISRAILVASGLLVSFSASAWLLSPPTRPPGILPRLGFVSALFCALAALVFCWAVALSSVARRRNWSREMCYISGALSVAVVLLGLAPFAGPGAQFGGLIACLPFFTGYLCRKLTYPELTEEEATAPEPPLSLFPP
jgi:hypothetical protein